MDEEPIRERRTLFPKITGKLDEFICSISMHPSFSETEIIPMVGTVKLHSAHADVVVHADNSISIQSRNQPYLTAANDVYGMYAFLAPLRLELLDLKTRIIKRYLDSNPGVKIKDDYPLIISGEWIGPGVQKGVAIDQLTSKCFVTISISVNGEWQRDEVYADLENEGVGIYNISRGGFFRHPLTVVDMEASLKSLQPLVDGVECPFAKSFGILGPGEGIVWKALQPSEDTKFWLKIKGSKFNGRAPRVDTNLKLEKADRTRAFADDVVQEWRLEQGWQYLGEMGTERSRAGMLSFRDWLISHVMVEERGVIEKLDLDEEILKKRISYLGKGPPSPPPSEDGCCPSGGRTVEPHLKPADVNNSTITTHSPPPTPPQNPRRVRDRLSVQKAREINRSKKFTNRLQRSASSPSPEDTVRRDSNIRRRTVQRYSAPVQDAGKSKEKANEQVLTKMAFAEQQRWITVQQKTFTKWLNTKIEPRGVAVVDLVKDLSDGVLLIHLLECLSSESLGRYAAKPKLRVQKFENANLSLDFIKSRGIQMTNIGAEDVVDGNRKIILGLIWTLILRFTISDINEEGMTAKEGLLLWCQRKTACYDEVDVRNFTDSWNDGLAFCALLDIHRPDLIDYDALDKHDHKGNMQLAFDIASKEIGIPDLLDVEDVCDVAKPDERSLMTYIAYWFHAFSQMEKVENAGRRVEKFVNNMQGAWEMQSAFERRMMALLKNIEDQDMRWHEAKFEGTYVDAKRQATEFSAYKREKKREWVAEKADLTALLGNIRTKLSTYGLRPYEPPPELRVSVLDQEWSNLMKSEMARGQLINETIRDIKKALQKSFADKANDFALALNTMQLAISGLEGEVEDQLSHVQRLNDNLSPLHQYLEKIAEIDRKCEEANIEENDFTTYTYDELSYELGLVKNSVSKKLAFLDNQVVARSMTNLTPIQLEEFESVFRHFDRDDSNSLQELEFSAALASLGLVFSEDEMHDYFLETSNGKDYVTFKQFIRFMVDVTEDQNTAEQVFQSFREVADGKPYVTEMDLRHSLVPDDVIEKLIKFVPEHKGPDLQQDRGMKQYDYISFMDNMIAGPEEEETPLKDLPNGRNPQRGGAGPGKMNYH